MAQQGKALLISIHTHTNKNVIENYFYLKPSSITAILFVDVFVCYCVSTCAHSRVQSHTCDGTGGEQNDFPDSVLTFHLVDMGSLLSLLLHSNLTGP